MLETIVVGNLQFIEDPSIQRYDELEISMEMYLQLFANENKDNFILVKFLGAPDYFQEYKVYKINAINHNAPNRNSITFINNTSFSRFNGQLTLTHCLVQLISESDIPILDSIFVSVPTEVYSLLHDKPIASVRHNFVTRYLTTPVVSRNELIRSINGEVVLCEPVNQGKVNENTSIFIVKNESSTLEKTPKLDHINGDIQLSSYLGLSLNFDLDVVKSPEFLVKPLANKILMNNLSSVWNKEDHDLFVFINTSDMFKLGFPIFNGDSVMLSSESQKIMIKVFSIIEPNRSFESGFIYVSPLLAINLELNDTSVVYLEPLPKVRDLLISGILPIAKSVSISRVASPVTLDKTYQQHFFSGLKTSFHSCFKAIKSGDFVPVVIDSILSKTMFDLGEFDEELSTIPTGDPDSVAWFKINEILGDEGDTNQYIIDPLKTRMILSGVEFIRLPQNKWYNWYKYLGLPPIFDYYESNGSNGTKFEYSLILRKILLTNINSKVNLKTTVLLNSMSRGLGKTTLVRSLSLELGLNLIELDCVDFINPGSELKTIGMLSGMIDKLLSESNTPDKSFNVIYLKHIENLCVEINENEQGSSITTSLTLRVINLFNEYFDRSNVIIIMSCNDIDKLNNNLRSIIKFQITFNVPNEAERLDIFKFLINNESSKVLNQEFNEEFDNVAFTGDYNKYPYGIRNDVNLSSLALQSAGLTPRDLISIVKKAKSLAIKRIAKLVEAKDNVVIEKLIKIGNGGIITLISDDFNIAINTSRNQFSDSIGAPKIPNVKWEDIGGLDVVKDEILDTIDMPLKYPELFNNGLKKRSGILFYGPPGTGKTLLAKAIATNFSLNFFSVKGPELLNMYIGESEANVRRVFQRARDAKPCVIFFDELDSVAPKRGNQGDSGGVMDRIVSQLLAELDGMSGGGGDGVFVVGATNRPDLLDEALLRPGRFDKMLYLGISDTNEKQVKILQALTRKFKLSIDVDLGAIAENCSFTFTGADFYALCSDSMLNAMTRIANEVDEKIAMYNEQRMKLQLPIVSPRWWFDNVASDDDIEVIVKMVDFIKAQRELVPSVSREELDHYLRVRQNFEGGKIENGKTENVKTEEDETEGGQVENDTS